MISKSCIGLGLVAWLLAAATAVAQEQRAPTEGAKPGVPEAPVGHRQPRATDVPASVQKTEAELRQEKQARELDRKLRICRNC